VPRIPLLTLGGTLSSILPFPGHCRSTPPKRKRHTQSCAGGWHDWQAGLDLRTGFMPLQFSAYLRHAMCLCSSAILFSQWQKRPLVHWHAAPTFQWEKVLWGQGLIALEG